MSRLFFFVLFSFVILSGTSRATTYASFDENTLTKKVWGVSLNHLDKNKPFEVAKEIKSYSLENKIEKETDSEKEFEHPAWLKNAISIENVPEESPMIAIVIDDLGLRKTMTREVLNLPAPITAAFLPYADDLPEQTELAKEKGHELLVHIPMEPINSRFNPGPNALKNKMSATEIIEKLDIMLSSFNGYVGINNHMGSLFTSNEETCSVVIRELKKRSLLFLDSLTSSGSIAWKKARDKNVPYAVRNIFLDNSQSGKDIMKQLVLLEEYALKHRTAVAIGHPHQVTVNALKEWIPQARKKGFVFVPVSLIALIKQEAFQ